jgi:hypothetical protein
MDNFYLLFCTPIWSHQGFSIEEKLILNFIWNFQMKTGCCYATNQYIATCFGLRVDRVKMLVAELQSAGYINQWEEDNRRYMECNLTKLEGDCDVNEDLFRDFSY